MKKNFLVIMSWLIVMIAIGVANDVVLYKMHDAAYYFTLPGFMLVATVCVVEIAILTPVSTLYLKGLLEKESYERYFGKRRGR